MPTLTGPQAREVFEVHLQWIQALTERFGKRHRLDREEREDFSSHVMVKMMEGDFAILRKFRGQSSLRTYLIVVANRLLLDYCVHQWGKWRPSAQARRLGPLGVQLDRLINRDGHSPDEAVEVLRRTYGAEVSTADLLQIASRVPQRGRRRFWKLEDLPPIAVDGGTERSLMEVERAAMAKKIKTALDRALARLPAQDRLVLKMRYREGLTVRQIAAALQMPAPALYHRCDRCLKRLKVMLRQEGITQADVVVFADWHGALDAMHRRGRAVRKGPLNSGRAA